MCSTTAGLFMVIIVRASKSALIKSHDENKGNDDSFKYILDILTFYLTANRNRGYLTALYKKRYMTVLEERKEVRAH